MKRRKYLNFWFCIFSIMRFLFVTASNAQAQSFSSWYKNAQQRIDTLRNGNFAIKIIDKNGQAYSGKVAVRMAKHEFLFDIAFDFYEGSVNSYTSGNTVHVENVKNFILKPLANGYLM
jgi:hypothetical protein